METITARRALELLIDVVDTYGPETVYERTELHTSWGEAVPENEDEVIMGCLYALDGAPSCLVGHVLHRAGATLNELRSLDREGVGASALADAIGSVEPDAAEVLDVAQRHQDNGATWGKALDMARDAYEKLRGLE